MRDSYNREITGLRISVTQECNLNCWYCHREGEDNPHGEISLETIKEIVAYGALKGVSSVKLTGGEPLLRDDIVDIVSVISGIEGIEDVSMTTNGLLLPGLAGELKRAGLTRVNIACDSLSKTLLAKNAKAIIPAISAARQNGLSPIKLNMVLLKGVNDHEVGEMMQFAGEHDAILQVIELIPNGDDEYFRRYHVDLAFLDDLFSRKARLIVKRRMHSRKQYYLEDTIVELVRPHSRDFCRGCNRLRITSDGGIKPCLRSDIYYPIHGSVAYAFEKALNVRVPFCKNVDD